MPEPDVIKSVRSLFPGSKDKKESIVTSVFTYIDNLQNKSPPYQMAVGSSAGLCTGYLFTRGSKATATVLGVSLIFFQFCNYRGYIKLNRSKFEDDLEKLSRGIRRELRGKTSAINEESVSNFFYCNAWILGGFVAGWLVGYGIA